MKGHDIVQQYITRVLAVVNQISAMGSELKDAKSCIEGNEKLILQICACCRLN